MVKLVCNGNCRCAVVPITDVMDYEPFNPENFEINNNNNNLNLQPISSFNDFIETTNNESVANIEISNINEIKESCKKIIDKEDLNLISESIYDFQHFVKDKTNEHLSIWDLNKNLILDKKLGKEKQVKVPDELVKQLKDEGGLFTLHNHSLQSTPLPSKKDLIKTIEYKTKYGISTIPGKGSVIIKNNDFINFIKKTESERQNIKDNMLKEYDDAKRIFEKEFSHEYKFSRLFNIYPREYLLKIYIEKNIKEYINIFNKKFEKYYFELELTK